MPRFRVLGLGAALVAAPGCKNVPCDEMVGAAVDVDFSQLRPSGRFIHRDESFSLELDQPAPGQARLRQGDAQGATEVIFAVEREGTTVQIEKVVQERGAGGSQDGKVCPVTTRYREERWTVPKITLRAQSAQRNGRPFALDASSTIGVFKAARFTALQSRAHFVDRANGDAYVGLELGNVDAPAFDIHFTRDGDVFRNGL